jgi:hypothetical protein
MKNNLAGISKRVVAAGLLTAAVVGLSSLAMHTPTQNQTALARPLKSIHTDKATSFYADNRQDRCSYIERTGETRLSAENLKLIAAAF